MSIEDVEPHVTATTDELDALDDGSAAEALLNGESSTLEAESLPQEFDELATAAETGDLDRDEARLAQKTRELETRDLTDVDEAGLEGNLKSLQFDEAEGRDGVDPQATRPDSESRRP